MQIPYSRLYLRMVLYIGAAMIAFTLIGVVSVFVIASYELRGYVAARQSPLAREAADALADGGRPALVRWLEDHVATEPDISIYILDSGGKDLLDRPLPKEFAAFVQESVVPDPLDDPDDNYLELRLTPRIVAPDGEALSFLVLPKSITLWGSAATRLGLIVVALLVAGVVALVIARAIGRPIRELQLAVRELASGHVHARVPAIIAARTDELGSLAADFNAMADRLEQLLSGREQLMQEMSHELRSPLARLQAALALASHRQSLTAEERSQIDAEISRMNHTIGAMLRFSSLDSVGTTAPRLVRLGKMLTELVNTEEVEAAAKGCRLDLKTERQMTLVGDPELLRSGFENILRNAIRHAPPNSSVEINARRAAGGFEVAIGDQGPGVAAEYLERIFEPFFRAPETADQSTGSGLGLAIAKRVFEAHDGEVTATARPGGGLLITVRLNEAEMS
ncbi:MAG: HAMP domain-containing histidine kinase [Chromatiales bacterium]|nr:MAG: HAMP domain-containing histidine kinase [Chromatiales bacterium]